MIAAERREHWQVARARSNVARQNAAYWDERDRPPRGIRGAIDELDHYLGRSPRPAWSGSALVFYGDGVGL